MTTPPGGDGPPPTDPRAPSASEAATTADTPAPATRATSISEALAPVARATMISDAPAPAASVATTIVDATVPAAAGAAPTAEGKRASVSAPSTDRAPAPAARTPATLTDDPSQPDLPARYDERELRTATGGAPRARRAASTEREREDEPPRRWTWRRVAIVAAAGVIAVAAGALAIAGQINRDRYVLTCEAERAVPAQGRGFPPWGTRAMTGEPWRPLAITRETRCRPLETDDVLVLERAYLAMIVERAAALLTAREVTKLDDVEALLQQALVLGRPPVVEPDSLARQRSDQRELTERMLGDVAYGRAAARLRDAATAMGEAARLYESANSQRPRYASDAAAASAYVRALARELQTGPLAATVAGASAPGGPRGTATVSAATGSAAATAQAAASTTAATTGSAGTTAIGSAAAPSSAASAASAGSGSAAATAGATPSTVTGSITSGNAAATNGAAAPSTVTGSITSGNAAATNGAAAPSTVAGPISSGNAAATNGAAAPSTVAGPGGAAAPSTVAGPGSANDRAGGAPPPMAERPVPASRSGATGEPDRAQAVPPDAGISTGGILL